jgi:malonyl CoA-acyl carrier protein transacylase/phosphopantetheinyl transferase (holo-ACP synthase)
MDVGSEAVFVGAQAMHAVLRRLGVTPDVMVGHSSGESSALAAARAIPWQQPADLAVHIRRLNGVYREILGDGKIPTGALLTVGALPLATVQQHIDDVDAGIVVAMHNCSNQLVLFGTRASIDALSERLTSAGGICVLLPFDRGYHTTAFEAASAAFRGYYDAIELGRPSVPLYSCATAERFPDPPEGIRDLAAAQWSRTVRFQETISRMHADGVTTFLEVGPSGNLTSFINDILGRSDYLALATNVRRRGGLEQLLGVVGHLYAEARPVQLAALFEGRAIAAIDPSGATKRALRGVVLDNTMPRIRLADADVARLQALVQTATVTSVVETATQSAPPASPESSPSASDSPFASVMPEYFRLMQAFLEHQSRVACEWSAVAGSESARDASDHAGRFAFLHDIVELDTDHIVAHCRLAVDRDAFLRDHVLSGAVSTRDPQLLGLSCVPLMVSLEIMAEACAVLAGTPGVRVIENVRANGWIALDEGAVELEVHARVVDAERRQYTAQLGLASGVVVSADFGFELSEVRCSALAPLVEHRPSVWNDDELYTSGMFHGPLFQSVEHLVGWDDSGMDARLAPVALRGFFVEGEQPQLVLNPVLLDAVGQLAAFWIAQSAGVEFNCFPSSIERIELYVPCPESIPGLELRGRQRLLDPAQNDVSAPRAWDFECIDASGQPMLRMRHLQNVYFAVPLRFYEVRRDPLQGWLGHPTRLSGRDDVLLWELEMLSETFCAQSTGIFLRILSQVYLSADERRAWHALGGNVRRRREWLLGRACIKEAVRYWIYQSTGELLFPTDVIVEHEELGAPYVDGWWRGVIAEAPAISLSHDAFGCTVAIASSTCRVGVDREALGRIRRPELVAQALTASEQSLLSGLDDASQQERLLRIWCAKEAAAKFLGIGMQGLPAAFEVQFADPAAHSAYVAHADSSVFVDLVRDDTSIIALASEIQEGIQ